jgi:hypothetical protein
VEEIMTTKMVDLNPEEQKEVNADFCKLHDLAQLADTMNPTVKGAFTGTPSERLTRQFNHMKIELEENNGVIAVWRRRTNTAETKLENTLKELKHLVRLLEPLEEAGTLNVPGLETLNGARKAITEAEAK